MIEYIDGSGRKRTAPNGQNQYLDTAVGVFPPYGETWPMADEWSKDLAGKLITIGWPNIDIEEHKREAKELPDGTPQSDEAKGFLRVYSIFIRLANVAIKAGILKENDSPANWLKWAESKGYEITHLTKYIGRTISNEDAALFARIDAMLNPFLKPIDYEQSELVKDDSLTEAVGNVGTIGKWVKPDDEKEFNLRLEALIRWMTSKGLEQQGDKPVRLKDYPQFKGYTKYLIYTELCGFDTAFLMAESTFNDFWQEQKLLKFK
ncbi:MAG: hypothetical protein M0R47_09595 [Methylobacter sp.]|uniref:hypothetical protein n=1 Tax=Methylobacter sp. TaxID=2051955 RepID=UPI0025DAE6F3|nr:hypothetical protein [Methylobacter sp.]MCK9620773.1 hypothetical protein [Methylobacter sp.]